MCGRCRDIVRLHHESKSCECGKSSGRYLDSNQAVYSDDAIPIGMHNFDLQYVLRYWPINARTRDIRAWTFAKDAPTYTYEETKGLKDD